VKFDGGRGYYCTAAASPWSWLVSSRRSMVPCHVIKEGALRRFRRVETPRSDRSHHHQPKWGKCGAPANAIMIMNRGVCLVLVDNGAYWFQSVSSSSVWGDSETVQYSTPTTLSRDSGTRLSQSQRSFFIYFLYCML
jgi:hypothetical protein